MPAITYSKKELSYNFNGLLVWSYFEEITLRNFPLDPLGSKSLSFA